MHPSIHMNNLVEGPSHLSYHELERKPLLWSTELPAHSLAEDL